MPKQKYTVLALFATIMIDALGWGIAFPVLAPIILNNTTHMLHAGTGLAARNFLYELSLGIYCIFMFLMSPILGSLSDKYGRKKILMLSMSGNCLGFLISGLAIAMHSLPGVLIGRSIAGATAGSLPIAQAAMIDISEGAQKAARLGLVVLANVSGFALGPIIGGFFMDQHIFHHISYPVPFFVSSAMAVLGVLLLLFCFKETFIGNKQLKINIFTSFFNLHQAFTAKETLTYCSVLLCFLFGWGILFSTIPVLLTERLGWNGADIGYFITYIGILFGIIVMLVLPKITKIFSLQKIVFFALMALVLCDFLFSMIHNSILPWIVILLAIAVPFTYVGIVTLLSAEVDSQKQGQIMGVTGSIFAFTWGVGPMLAGSILKIGLIAPYMLAGIFFLLALVLFYKQKNKMDRAENFSGT